MKVFLFLMIISLFYLARKHKKSVADTHLKGWICHAFSIFSWMMLFCQSKLLHKSLWLRIVAAEVAVDHSLILCSTH